MPNLRRATSKKCELLSGAPRFQSHIEREYIARDHNLKQSPAKPPSVKKLPKR
jgi:hypothetical protein